MTKEQLKAFLEKEGFLYLRDIPGRGWCGVRRNLFTWGLFYGMGHHGIVGRYCFGDLSEVKASLNEWDGSGDPPGDWIKHFGPAGEYGNPVTEIDLQPPL